MSASKGDLPSQADGHAMSGLASTFPADELERMSRMGRLYVCKMLVAEVIVANADPALAGKLAELRQRLRREHSLAVREFIVGDTHQQAMLSHPITRDSTGPKPTSRLKTALKGAFTWTR